jgi:ElaB/YqjD/DUF883 family membrane-anchored ribosome-binding protein
MTDAYTPAQTPEDIDDEAGVATARLDAQADEILAAGAGPDDAGAAERRTTSVRQALREDAAALRARAAARADRARLAVQEEPLRATFYALGVGVLIGLLLRR